LVITGFHITGTTACVVRMKIENRSPLMEVPLFLPISQGDFQILQTFSVV